MNPHTEPSGGYAPLSERDGTFHDARATSANTNDLRGKILRIHPEDDGTYTIPAGNLFPESEDSADKTLPEIYAMGFRNPFRFAIDPATGYLGVADYSPDNSTDNLAQRGPAGIAEWNLIKEPGFFGWPLCMGDNEPFRDVDYRTSPVTVGEFFDCAAPVNDSVRNTGLTDLPPAQPADMWYGYQRSSVPGGDQPGRWTGADGRPVLPVRPRARVGHQVPRVLRGQGVLLRVGAEPGVHRRSDGPEAARASRTSKRSTAFLPDEDFLAPIDAKFGPDGAMYVLDWGGGFGRDNPDSGLHRVDYVTGSRSPQALPTATPDSGSAPLEVTFDGTGSTDPEGENLSYAWDFDGDGTTDSTEPTRSHTYTADGVYDARLTVTDPRARTGPPPCRSPSATRGRRSTSGCRRRARSSSSATRSGGTSP